MVAGYPAPMPKPPDAATLEQARTLLSEHPLIDGHNDLPWEIRSHPAARGDLEAYDLRVAAPPPG